MKRLLFLIMACFILVSFDKDPSKVLLYIEDGSIQLEYMLLHEVGQMTKILKQSGFEVTIATLSGEVLKTDSITVTPDLKLGKVKTADYAGFIMPCMANADTVVTSEEKTFVRKINNEGKPIAAQLGAVWILAKAGILDGKKYALMNDAGMVPEFKDGIYSGSGVVQDGNIITSGICPWMAKQTGNPDGTAELTKALISTIRAKAK